VRRIDPIAGELADLLFRQFGHVDQVLRADGPFLIGGEFTTASRMMVSICPQSDSEIGSY